MIQPDPEQVHAVFEQFQGDAAPGCALGVMLDGELVFSSGYGCASLEHGIPITTGTVFPVASMSKQFTAFALALLAERGELSLDDAVRSVLPEVPDFGSEVTFRHLVHHTSGLRGDLMLLLSAGWRLEDVITNEDVFRLICRQQALNFPPGERFSYCGSGYLLLALAVERLSGLSLQHFCAREIFEPLGMAHTRFMEDPLEIIPNRADAYYPADNGLFRKAVLTSSLTGGTGLFTTVGDLARWDSNFLSGQVGGASTLALVHERGRLNDGRVIPYAFGLIWDGHRGHEVLVHGGDGAGIHSYMIRFPELHFTVAVLGNSSGVRARQLARGVADLYVDDRSTTPGSVFQAPPVIDLSADVTARRAGRYFDPESLAFVDLDLVEGDLYLWGNRMLPESENRFFAAASPDVTLLFQPAGEGESESMLLDLGMGPAMYLRAEPADLTGSSLPLYCGSYFSEELGVTWEVLQHGESLVVLRSGQGTSELVPAAKDTFLDHWVDQLLHAPARPFTVAFHRDALGAMDGMLVSDGGASVMRMWL